MKQQFVLLALCVALATAYPQSYVPQGTDFPLFDYVDKVDTHYTYKDTGITINGTGWTGHLINMTSQQWLTYNDTNRAIWWHQLVIIIPDNMRYTDTAAIYATGGDNDGFDIPKPTDEDILVSAVLATATGSAVATLYQIPNQPVVFAEDPTKSHRSEDSFVAYSWLEYLRHQDRPEWVDLLPMVKSVVRAMDTMVDYLAKKQIAKVEKFAIAGASKRGWTTWLTGAADTRVVAIMPIVMDMLNFTENVAHMYKAYGGWTFAFKDYYNVNITQDLDTDKVDILSKIVDPLVYKDYLKMPKLVIDSTGDEFFMPDDDHFWWGDLEGETYRLMVQNAEHSMATGVLELLIGADAFYQSILSGVERPKFNWTIDPTTGDITVVTTQKPTKAVMQAATTFDNVRRDFRLIKGNTTADPCKFIPVHVFGNACINPVFWFPTTLEATEKDGVYTYVASQPVPTDGKWRGFFVEMFYPGPEDSDYRLTTQVSIVPNTFPFPDCRTLPSGCKGVLV